MQNLELGLIGNCAISALVDDKGAVVWSCFPRLDGDATFYSLLNNGSEDGAFSIELEGYVRTEQYYEPNSAILVTRLLDADDDGVEITDFCPRFEMFGRTFRPCSIARIVRPIGKVPTIRVRIRPGFEYGSYKPQIARGSNHIRFSSDTTTWRVTTDAPITYVIAETAFRLEDTISFLFGTDESLKTSVRETCREFHEKTLDYWQKTVRRLAIPYEWQDAVIRSAITLKLCSYEETGGIVAAMTTSLPESDGEGRNWDYRFCWLRDTLFVVRALNRLGYIETMEDYLVYLGNIIGGCPDGYLQPVFGIGLETQLTETQVEGLAGYRNNQPVRVGNQAHEHHQHDGYGSVLLAASQAFYDGRLHRPAGRHTFVRLEKIGEMAFQKHNVPDAGLWEFRSLAHVHTHSSVMCWAACDRLARIAEQLKLDDRARFWADRAQQIKDLVMEKAWDEERQTFTAAFGAPHLDAALLLLHEVGFVSATDPKFVGTVKAIEEDLKHGEHMFRYKVEDDFGEPENAFIVCTFWYIDALAEMGRKDEARKLFDAMLKHRNKLGLFSEHVHLKDGEMWGNFPQTYSHVGLINCAMKLSKSWEDVV